MYLKRLIHFMYGSFCIQLKGNEYEKVDRCK
nr:MAG TPA: hypothetical protein [Caudoviricetes sp.]